MCSGAGQFFTAIHSLIHPPSIRSTDHAIYYPFTIPPIKQSMDGSIGDSFIRSSSKHHLPLIIRLFRATGEQLSSRHMGRRKALQMNMAQKHTAATCCCHTIVEQRARWWSILSPKKGGDNQRLDEGCLPRALPSLALDKKTGPHHSLSAITGYSDAQEDGSHTASNVVSLSNSVV